MKKSTKKNGTAKLGRVREQLAGWRKRRAKGARIPEAIWQQAVKLSEVHGVSRVSRELGLDYYGLRDRAEATVPEGGAKGNGELFVELSGGLAASGAECVLELEDGCGGRMRVECRGPCGVDAAELAQELWGARR